MPMTDIEVRPLLFCDCVDVSVRMYVHVPLFDNFSGFSHMFSSTCLSHTQSPRDLASEP